MYADHVQRTSVSYVSSVSLADPHSDLDAIHECTKMLNKLRLAIGPMSLDRLELCLDWRGIYVLCRKGLSLVLNSQLQLAFCFGQNLWWVKIEWYIDLIASLRYYWFRL